ncbi:uncharacterized protein CLUP02_09141 [Colletotrichum lupini]|uniref:Uncharacterized protein n=1 Tax=Colletotrichum lupini TaxID=145971 RepID=A0A9Q8WHN3_9PEZI|nr:uncharacterized protein CLUP02_09141 [Colletotrichum lupini]UQC83646.1 hypothetical protein CLUP02_09141 [Colletotrichum lupini]
MQFVDVGTTIGPIKLAKGVYPSRSWLCIAYLHCIDYETR